LAIVQGELMTSFTPPSPHAFSLRRTSEKALVAVNQEAWGETARKAGALPQLRNPQVQRPRPGVERPVAVAVAISGPGFGPFEPSGADHAGFHDKLENGFGDGARNFHHFRHQPAMPQAENGIDHIST
jgi:hypothetical protein